MKNKKKKTILGIPYHDRMRTPLIIGGVITILHFILLIIIVISGLEVWLKASLVVFNTFVVGILLHQVSDKILEIAEEVENK